MTDSCSRILRHVPLARCIAVLGLVTLAATACTSKEAPDANAATKPRGVPVTVGVVEQRDVPISVTAIGNVQAFSTVGVLSQVNGQIMKVHFTEGQDVKEGQLLFTIDPRPFQASLDQAQANVARDQAQLGQAQASAVQREAEVQQADANLARDQAQWENARVQQRRYQELADKQFVAREQADQMRTNAEALAATVRADQAAIANARASLRAAQAAVENAKATVRADEAMVENARLQLAYTHITAPMTGRTGNLLIHEGNVVKANDVGNPMVSINRVHPIYVTFAVPEQYLPQVKQFLAERTLRVETPIPGSDRRAEGELTFVNNTVDPATGMIQLKATFANTENTLWPGQFVNVDLTLTTLRQAVVTPSPAVQVGQTGSFVFVVKPDQTVEMRTVKPARTIGSRTIVEAGLRAGERVVTDGQLRLAPGVKVDIKTSAS